MSRNNKNIYAILVTGIALFVCSGIVAQDKPFDTIQVNVITRYKPTIHDAVKLNSNPAVADTLHLQKNVKYELENTQYPTSYTPPLIPPMQIKEGAPENFYHSLLNLGVGNFNTLYGEYFFNSVRSHNTDYGIHLNHLSSEYTTAGYGYSGFAFNDVDGYFQKFFTRHTLDLQAGFDNHILHDYGYDIVRFPDLGNDLMRARYDEYKGSLQYASVLRDSSKINEDIKLSYYNFGETDGFNAGDYYFFNPLENNVSGNMKFFTYFNQQRIDVRVSGEYNEYSSSNPIYRQIPFPTRFSINTFNGTFNPYFSTYEKHWDAHLGVNVSYASNLPDNYSNVNVYPDLLARYHIAQDVVMIYAGIDGNQKLNTYKSLADENPFVVVQVPTPFQYTYTPYHVFGGLAGNITSQLTYNASVSQSMLRNMPLFITDVFVAYNNQFYAAYDNVKISNLHADVDYKWKNNLSVILGGDYNVYNTTNQLKAWYCPALKLSAMGKYTLQKKYIFKAEFFVVGSQYAPVETDDGIITGAKTLAGYPDLNLGLEYRYNKVFTAFLNLNNIANVAYYTWDNYEMMRFNLLVGIRLGF